MKKIFIILTLMFLIPLNVNAEVKEFEDMVYVTEENSFENYYCEEIKDSNNIQFENYGENIIIVDFDSDTTKRYMFNILEKSCKLITEEEYEEIVYADYSMFDSYTWKDDNKIYKEVYTKEGIVEKYTPEIYGFVHGRDYYILKDGKYVQVENPVESDVNDYYYKESFGKAQGEFYDYINYYVVKDDNTLILDETPTEEEFNKGLYYEMKLRNIVLEEFMTLKNTNFVLSKEVSKLSSDIAFTKDDFVDLYKIKDNYYMIFDYKIDDNNFKFIMFDLEGNLVNFSDKYLFDNLYPSSEDGLFSIVFYENNKSIVYILDNKFNLIYNETMEEEGASSALITSFEHIDYFDIQTYNEEKQNIDIIKVKKYYLVGKDDKYNNKDMNYTLSANLSNLKSILINGKEISKDNYTTKDNVLTLKNSYLSKLEKGTYTLKVLYNDEGYVETDFVMDLVNPNTGDNIISSIILGSISLIGCISIILYLKKNNKIKN